MPARFETERCSVGPPRFGDAPAIRALHLDAEARRYLGGPLGTEAAMERAWRIVDGASGDDVMVVRLRRAGLFVGLLYLGRHRDDDARELSYVLAPAHWGRGLATEAILGLLRCLGGETGRLVAETQEANLASRAVLAKIGMREERRVDRFGARQVIYGLTLGT